jgi:hypothetical protein
MVRVGDEIARVLRSSIASAGNSAGRKDREAESKSESDQQTHFFIDAKAPNSS